MANKNNSEENIATAYGKNLSASIKQSVEICNFIRNKKLETAKKILEGVVLKKQAIPFKRFNRDMAHRPGMGPGRYPGKAAVQILDVLKNAESNAINKGLSANDLYIVTIYANKASAPWHYGRQRRRKMKRSHVKVCVSEKKIEKEKDKK